MGYINPTEGRFGRLTVIKPAGIKNRRAIFECLCDCGKITFVQSKSLRSGNTKSCGCIHQEQLVARNTTHSLRYHPLYVTWQNMKKRCYYKGSKDYKDYGGRGIKVNSAWHDFPSFLHDMEPSWKKHVKKYGRKNTSIDRINNNDDYRKGNCRWATPKEQIMNSRRTFIVTFNGKRAIFSDLVKQLGLKYDTVYMRIRRGWSIKNALT